MRVLSTDALTKTSPFLVFVIQTHIFASTTGPVVSLLNCSKKNGFQLKQGEIFKYPVDIIHLDCCFRPPLKVSSWNSHLGLAS